MISAPLPPNERQRQAALSSYGILDTGQDEVFDALTQAAAAICEMPISVVGLIDGDRVWIKSAQGVPGQGQTPRALAFCAHAILDDDITEIPDARQDARFADNPFVLGEPNIRFYAAAPLIDAQHAALGTLCVIDSKPRRLTSTQRNALVNLAKAAMRLLEAGRTKASALAMEQLLDHSSQEFYIAELDRYRVVGANAQARRAARLPLHHRTSRRIAP